MDDKAEILSFGKRNYGCGLETSRLNAEVNFRAYSLPNRMRLPEITLTKLNRREQRETNSELQNGGEVSLVSQFTMAS